MLFFAMTLCLGTAATQAKQDMPATPGSNTDESPMMHGDTPATGNGWTVQALFTVGEMVQDYRPVGILEGSGAIELNPGLTRIFVNHELGEGLGHPAGASARAAEAASKRPIVTARPKSSLTTCQKSGRHFRKPARVHVVDEATDRKAIGYPRVRSGLADLLPHVLLQISEGKEPSRDDGRLTRFSLQPGRKLLILEGEHATLRVVDDHELPVSSDVIGDDQ
jgi:hypothetical protein